MVKCFLPLLVKTQFWYKYIHVEFNISRSFPEGPWRSLKLTSLQLLACSWSTGITHHTHWLKRKRPQLYWVQQQFHCAGIGDGPTPPDANHCLPQVAAVRQPKNGSSVKTTWMYAILWLPATQSPDQAPDPWATLFRLRPCPCLLKGIPLLPRDCRSSLAPTTSLDSS